MRGDGRVLIGIAGCPGAGKSTVARWLAGALDPDRRRAVQVPMDGFHLADAALRALGRLDRKGAIDTFDGHGYLSLLRRAAAETGSTVYAPEFDRRLEEPVAGSIPIGPEVEVVVTEGNYLLDSADPWPDVREALTEVWYCETDDGPRLERLSARHRAFGKSAEETRAWIEAVDEPNARRIRKTRDNADLVFDYDALGLGAAA
ncbi:nucleoside/nucleotide kinase family protein [Glycomyces albus]